MSRIYISIRSLNKEQQEAAAAALKKVRDGAPDAEFVASSGGYDTLRYWRERNGTIHLNFHGPDGGVLATKIVERPAK